MFVTAGLLVSLYKYRLYDAEAVVSRSVAYAALTAILLALFAATEKTIELLGEEIIGESLGVLADVIGAAVATVMVVPLHHRLTGWAERRFQTAHPPAAGPPGAGRRPARARAREPDRGGDA